VRRLTCSAALIILWCQVASATTYYVSTAGDDGTGCTLVAPCQTLARARTVVRAEIAAGMSSPITVKLRGGTYYQDATFELGALDSGTSAYSVVWTSYQGESAIVSGGQAISGWVADVGSIFKANIGTAWNFRQLYVNGANVPRARGARNPAGWTRTATGYVSAANMSAWRNPSKIELVSLGNWAMHRVPVASISGTAVTMGAQAWALHDAYQVIHSIRATPSWVENAYELMTENSYWLDQSTGYVYLWPTGGSMSGMSVTAPVTETLVRLTGASNITLSNLTFAYSSWLTPEGPLGYVGEQSGDRWIQAGWEPDNIPAHLQPMPGAVDIVGSHDIRIHSSQFEHLGTRALFVRGGSQSVSIKKNRFADNAGGAVQIGDGITCPSLRESAITLADNYIASGNSFMYVDNGGIYAACMTASTVANNETVNSEWTSISLGWVGDDGDYTTNSEVYGNKFINGCHTPEFIDCASIYFRGEGSVGSFATGVRIHNNLIDGATLGEGGCFYGDSYTSWVSFNRNVCQNTMRWIRVPAPSAHDINATGNYVWSTSGEWNAGTRTNSSGSIVIGNGVQNYGTPAQAITCPAGVSFGVAPGVLPSTNPQLWRRCSRPIYNPASIHSPPTTSMVGDWPIREGKGSIVYNYRGAPTAMWLGADGGPNGHYDADGYAYFNGSSNAVDLGTSAAPLMSATGPWTVVGWLNTNATNPNSYIFNQYGHTGAEEGMLTYLTGTGPFRFRLHVGTVLGGYSLRNVDSIQEFSANSWHFFMAQRNGKNFAVSVDGGAWNTYADPDAGRSIYQFANVIGGTAATGTTGLPPTLFFKGGISGVKFYSRALSIAEVSKLYRLGRP
jgi:hypothetical protein